MKYLGAWLLIVFILLFNYIHCDPMNCLILFKVYDGNKINHIKKQNKTQLHSYVIPVLKYWLLALQRPQISVPNTHGGSHTLQFQRI